MTTSDFINVHFDSARDGVDTSVILFRNYIGHARECFGKGRYRLAWHDFKFALSWFWFAWCDGRGYGSRWPGKAGK